MKMQPSKWLWGLLPLAVPFFGAWIFNTNALEKDISAQAMSKLHEQGVDWVELTAKGRDVSLSGEAVDQVAIDKAAQLVAGVYGVRRVDIKDVQIARDVTPPAAPTVDNFADPRGKPVLTGTFDKAESANLIIKVNEEAYELGKNQQLSADDAGNWTLKLPEALADGTYNVTAEAVDAAGNAASGNLSEPLVLVAEAPAVPPAKPVIDQVTTNTPAPVLTGTWEETDGSSLQVSVHDKDYTLGDSPELTSQSGRWKLALGSDLPDGSYDAVAKVTNAEGITTETVAAKALLVDRTGPGKPSVNKIISNSPTPVITGTWPDTEADKLTVKFGNQSYVLGSDQALQSDADGVWTLQTATPLADGVYNVVVQAGDKAGNAVHDDTDSEVIIDTVPPAAPTVSTLLTTKVKPQINGGWQPEESNNLTVALAGKSYTVGHDDELQVTGNVWTLSPAEDLAEGVYDVVVTAVDKAGNSATDSTTDEVNIDMSAPSAPTIDSYNGEDAPTNITGTWPKGDAETLSVTLGNNSYTLNTDSELTSDDSGKWNLALSDKLQPGTYDVMVKVADKAGHQSVDATKDEIVISAAKEMVVDCQAEFNRILSDQKIGFDSGKATIMAKSKPLISQLADVASKCPSVKIKISGHTDSDGSSRFNQELSNKRATAVVKALINAGIAAQRLQAIGFGEAKPIADNATDEGKAKNRRIEFTVIE